MEYEKFKCKVCRFYYDSRYDKLKYLELFKSCTDGRIIACPSCGTLYTDIAWNSPLEYREDGDC